MEPSHPEVKKRQQEEDKGAKLLLEYLTSKRSYDKQNANSISYICVTSVCLMLGADMSMNMRREPKGLASRVRVREIHDKCSEVRTEAHASKMSVIPRT